MQEDAERDARGGHPGVQADGDDRADASDDDLLFSDFALPAEVVVQRIGGCARGRLCFAADGGAGL